MESSELDGGKSELLLLPSGVLGAAFSVETGPEATLSVCVSVGWVFGGSVVGDVVAVV